MKIFIKGLPGTGKTTIIKSIAKEFGSWFGFYTEELRERGKRFGFKVVSPFSSFILASVYIKSPYRVGKYFVDVKSLENFINENFSTFTSPSKKLILIDEYGKMETFSPSFLKLLEKILEDDEKVVVLTLPEKGMEKSVNSLIKRHKPEYLFGIDIKNREKVKDDVIRILKSHMF